MSNLKSITHKPLSFKEFNKLIVEHVGYIKIDPEPKVFMEFTDKVDWSKYYDDRMLEAIKLSEEGYVYFNQQKHFLDAKRYSRYFKGIRTIGPLIKNENGNNLTIEDFREAANQIRRRILPREER